MKAFAWEGVRNYNPLLHIIVPRISLEQGLELLKPVTRDEVRVAAYDM